MKTKQTRTAFSNLYSLTALIAVGTVLVLFAAYAVGRTGTSEASRQPIATIPPPQGSVTEAWVNRVDGPAHGHRL